MKAELHPAEAERLAALRCYDILDTPREADFDDIVQIVSAICEAPVSVITLLDEGRQWFKAEVGLGVSETPLQSSICAHAILQPDLLIVPDTLQDKRFQDNPLVTGDPHLRFYAGAVLETPEGLPLGTVCVLDYQPRNLNDNQRALLRLMARQVMKMLELRRLVTIEHAGRLKAEALLKENATLARESDHRVMNSLQLVASVLGLQARSTDSKKAKGHLESARTRVQAIATVHKQLHLSGSMDMIDIGDFLTRLCQSLKLNSPSFVGDVSLRADKAMLASELASMLGLLVAELVANSFKHALSESHPGSIRVDFKSVDNGWQLRVADDGVGLPRDFDPAKTKGVGMRVVKALVERLKASLEISSASPGAVFTVNFQNKPEIQIIA